MKRRNQFLIGILMFVLSSYAATAACTVDMDGDNYGIECVPPQEDCNDNDPYVNPGMPEVCANGANGVDDNCNGQVDESPCSTCIDRDSDGYGNPGSAACTHPEADCDDTDNLIFPDAPENTFKLCVDGTDNNCDGLIDKDDPSCLEFYPSAAKEENLGLQTPPTGCQISSPIWADQEGSSVTEAEPDTNITMIVSGSNCKGEEVILSIYKQNATEPTQSDMIATFGQFQDSSGNTLDNQAIYSAKAPIEPGKYTFTATSALGTLTSEALTVESLSATSCEIQWDCSAIDYGQCANGMKTREVCPGSEGSGCCADEASCLCKAIYPEDSTCETYTYAQPSTQKTCAEVSGLQKFKVVASTGTEEEQAPEAQPSPLIWIIGGTLAIIAIAATAYILLKKSQKAIDVPAALLNYVKAAKDKKIPEQAIKDALTKSGWKPEQISAALKKAK